MANTPVKILIGKALSRAIAYPEETELFVSNPAEALAAINANTKGRLRVYLSKEDRYYRVSVGHWRNALTKEELSGPSGQQTIYILPVIRGRKSGVGKIVIGAALLALAIVQPEFASTAVGYIGGYGSVGLIGASLILGGVSQLLAPTPNFNQDSQGDSRGSNIFGGNATAVSQGGAVGLVYGRALVTPMPISISFTAYNQPIAGSNSFAPATATTTTSPGGLVNQVINAPDPQDNLP